MKAFINKVTDIEFYSKHAGLKVPAKVILFAAQIGSGCSAFFGVLAVGGHSISSYVIAFTLAVMCELVVKYFGYQYFLSYAERKTNVTVYDIEADKRRLSSQLDTWKKALLFIAGGTTTTFTLLGCFMYLFLKVEIPDRLDQNKVVAEQNNIATQKADKANATLNSSIAMLQADIDRLQADIDANDVRADKAEKAYKRSQQLKQGKNGNGIWNSETTFWNNWRNKRGKKRNLPSYREQAVNQLESKKENLLSLSTTVASTQASFLGAATGIATGIVEDNKAFRWEQIKVGASKGAFGILGGIICQILAFAMLFVIACIDLGSGTTKRYIRHFMDGRNPFWEFYLAVANRFKMTVAYHTASYAKSDLREFLFWGKKIKALEAQELVVEELFDDNGTSSKDKTEESPSEPSAAFYEQEAASMEQERLEEEKRAIEREKQAAKAAKEEAEAAQRRLQKEKAAADKARREAQEAREIADRLKREQEAVEQAKRIKELEEAAERQKKELKEAAERIKPTPAPQSSSNPLKRRKRVKEGKKPVAGKKEKPCLNCSNPFPYSRSTAKYCSQKCKKDYLEKMAS